jgi:NAD(P)H dehydrogenase (quinone)
VLLSAVAAVLPEGNGPAADLHRFERALEATGTTLSIIRACWLQENIQSVVPVARSAGIYPCLMASADAVFPTVSTRDVGRIAASLLVSPPPASEIVDVTGPSYSTRRLADALSASLGKPLQVVNVPAAERIPALMQAGLPQPFAEAVAEMYACLDSGRVRPQGDRGMSGAITIDETLSGLLVPERT